MEQVKEQETIRELLGKCEGHVILKTTVVVKVLKNSGYEVTRKEKTIVIAKAGVETEVGLIFPPKGPAKSKYDIESWNKDKVDNTGVWDLNLVSALVNIKEKLTETKYDGGSFREGSFQFQAYLDWLNK